LNCLVSIFKIDDSEPSVLREALESVLFFITIPMCHMARAANKVQLGVFLQYPTFNWVSFTHIHTGIIYRESYTRIPLYLILCITLSIAFCCAHLENCSLLCLNRCQIFLRTKDSFWLNQNHLSRLLLRCGLIFILDTRSTWKLGAIMFCLVYKKF